MYMYLKPRTLERVGSITEQWLTNTKLARQNTKYQNRLDPVLLLKVSLTNLESGRRCHELTHDSGCRI
jgi:hypothetical protein